MQVGGDLVPPNGEVLSNHVSQVRAVRRWLGHQVLEDLAWSLPGSGLHTKIGADAEGHGQSHGEVKRRTPKMVAHHHIGGTPSKGRVDHELARELLQLPGIKLLHSQDFVVRQIVIINVREPVPVLSR